MPFPDRLAAQKLSVLCSRGGTDVCRQRFLKLILDLFDPELVQAACSPWNGIVDLQTAGGRRLILSDRDRDVPLGEFNAGSKPFGREGAADRSVSSKPDPAARLQL